MKKMGLHGRKQLLTLVLGYFPLFFVIASAQVNNQNYLIGLKFISYDNPNGTIATGDCCDEPGKTSGFCSPDMCDSTFRICGTRNPNKPCDVFRNQFTPVTYNNNSLTFGKMIGNVVNKSSSLFVFKFPFQKTPINFNITALEVPDVNSTGPPPAVEDEIAQFQFVVNWFDPRFINPPHYRRFVLNDTTHDVQFVVDVVSMCSKHYYTHNCAVFCKPDHIHYTCLNNGTKLCLPGWYGPNCMKMINHCPGNSCMHGSICVPILLNYTCKCLPNYTGFYCQTWTGTTPIPTTSPSTISTNPTPSVQSVITTPVYMTSVSSNNSNHNASVQSVVTTPVTSVSTKPLFTGQDIDSLRGQVAGGMTGAFLLLLLLLLLFWCMVCKKYKRKKVEPDAVKPFQIYVGQLFNYEKTGKTITLHPVSDFPAQDKKTISSHKRHPALTHFN